jgi:hypothetical protein
MEDVTGSSEPTGFPAVAEAEHEVTPPNDDEDGADDSGCIWKKERVAIVFGYVGARFQGLQRNPGAFTVEDELEGALHRAGGITASNLGDFHKCGWNRCARTDKGVHAMGQVRARFFLQLRRLCSMSFPYAAVTGCQFENEDAALQQRA